MGNNVQGKETSNKVEWVKALGPYVVIFTVIVAGFIDRNNLLSEMEERAATRLLNNITLLDKSNSCTVRAGAVTTMGEHLRGNYMHQYRTIQVAAYHLGEEDDAMVRAAIVNLLREAKVDVIDTLASVNRVVINKIEKESCDDKSAIKERLLEFFIGGNMPDEESLVFDKLRAINEALVTLLKNNHRDKLDLSELFLVSPEKKHYDLKNTFLKKAVLKKAFLYKVDLTNAFLHGADLEDALLAEVILNNAVLSSAKLVGVDLAFDKLSNAQFVGADLSSAILHDANMAEATLDNADIVDANLTNAILRGASLKGANMTVTRLERAILKGAKLDNANLNGANLSGADLRGASLTGANLSAATLQGANLEVKDIEGASLENADLRALVLFSIDSNDFQGDLKIEGTVSEYLQQEFQSNGFYLPQSAILSVEKTDQKWLINDKENGKEYTIRKEKEQLNICIETKFVTEDIKKANNWEKAIFDDDVWQKLSSSQD